MPKSDRCDVCAEFNLISNPYNEDDALRYENHRQGKISTKNERDKDRMKSINELNTSIDICYDLQDVFTLLRASIGSFYYRRKLRVYNLTAHCSKNKNGYCAVWSEAVSG